VREFWTERHLCTLTTLRPDGSPHVVPVGVTFDPETMTARVIASSGTAKVRHIEAGTPARVAVCQVDGRRWSSLEGTAIVRREDWVIADAVERYAQRYRQPRVNPHRVAIEITVTNVLGLV
jgi:F420H(2)-dependent biliverdin reductase